MQDVINYVTGHYIELLNIVTAVIAAASLIANLTPTETDNKIIAAISKFINTFALNFKK